MTVDVAALIVRNQNSNSSDDGEEDVFLPLGGVDLFVFFRSDNVDEAALGDFDLRLLFVTELLADFVREGLDAVGGTSGVGEGSFSLGEVSVSERLRGKLVGDGEVVTRGELVDLLGLVFGEGSLVVEDYIESGSGTDVLGGDGDGDGLAGDGVEFGDVLVDVDNGEVLLLTTSSGGVISSTGRIIFSSHRFFLSFLGKDEGGNDNNEEKNGKKVQGQTGHYCITYYVHTHTNGLFLFISLRYKIKEIT